MKDAKIRIQQKSTTMIIKKIENNPINCRTDFIIVFILIVATIIVYQPISEYDFLNLDDDAYVWRNPDVRRGLTYDTVYRAFTEVNKMAGYWIPLTWLSHMSDVTLYGMNPGPHHLTNLFFHIANVLLLFTVLTKMTGCMYRSGFVAALFALHPLHVESVAWIAERKDVLFTFFWMLTLLCYNAYCERRRLISYLLILIFFIMGIMSKPMIITLPFVLLLLDYWPLQRIRFDQFNINNLVVNTEKAHLRSEKRACLLRQIFRLVLEKTPLFIISACLAITTVYTQSVGEAVVSLQELSLQARIDNALVAYISYIWKLLWPSQLGVYYPHPGILPLWKVAGAGFLIIILSFWAVKYGKRYRYLPIGWFWYLGTLFPVIGLVQAGLQAMADRFVYVPFIGLYIVITWGAADIFKKWRVRRAYQVLAATTVFCLLAAITLSQIKYWKNSVTLFEHTLEVTSNNYLIHNNLGTTYMYQQQLQKAGEHFKKALAIYPEYEIALSNM
jgi:tetratricopeptide (TPR) repeat protein